LDRDLIFYQQQERAQNHLNKKVGDERHRHYYDRGDIDALAAVQFPFVFVVENIFTAFDAK
jgi:hypothetical protein